MKPAPIARSFIKTTKTQLVCCQYGNLGDIDAFTTWIIADGSNAVYMMRRKEFQRFYQTPRVQGD